MDSKDKKYVDESSDSDEDDDYINSLEITLLEIVKKGNKRKVYIESKEGDNIDFSINFSKVSETDLKNFSESVKKNKNVELNLGNDNYILYKYNNGKDLCIFNVDNNIYTVKSKIPNMIKVALEEMY